MVEVSLVKLYPRWMAQDFGWWKVNIGSGNGLMPLDTHLCRNSLSSQSFPPSGEQPDRRKLAHML